MPVRLSLGRFLALGLEFQLASDILRTASSPTLREIGKPTAVVAIRTALTVSAAVAGTRRHGHKLMKAGQRRPALR